MMSMLLGSSQPGDHPCRASLVPVVSHMNGESSWVSSQVAHLPEPASCPAQSAQSCGKSSRDNLTDRTDRIFESIVADRMVRQIQQQVENGNVVEADSGTSKKVHVDKL